MTANHTSIARADTRTRSPRSRSAPTESKVGSSSVQGLELYPAPDLHLSRGRDDLPRAGAALVRRLQAKVGNQAVQRLIARSVASDRLAIRRAYDPTQAETREIDDMIPRNWGQLDKDLANARGAVTYWCQSHAQFLSLVNNLSWDEFQALKKKYKSGTLVPTKIAGIRLQMQREMKAELAEIAQKAEEARRQQIEKFRTTGQPGVNLTYAAAHQQNIISGFAHAHTFRTDAEKLEKKGHQTGPFTRNFSVRVDNQPALWEIHVHYKDSVDQQVTKAHVKLISQRHTHEHVRDLSGAGVIVQATTPTISVAIDNTLVDL